MVLVNGNPRIWLAGLVASLVIFAVIFFTVIQPDQNTANQALKTGLKQSQQVINQAQKQLNTAAGGQAGVTSQAHQALSRAAKLTNCVAAAGTDTGKLQACQAKYAG